MTGETEALFDELADITNIFQGAVTSGESGYLCGCGLWVPWGQDHACGLIGEGMDTASYICIFCHQSVLYGDMHTCISESFDRDVKTNQVLDLLHKICAKLNIEVE